MMLNTYVTKRMVQWADWSLKRDAGALGYPKQAPYTRLAANGGTSGYIPDLDSDAMEVDKIMSKIKIDDSKTYRVLHMFYGIDFEKGHAVPTLKSTAALLAAEYGCHRDTLYAWLEKGHRLLMDGFHENDVIAHIRK
jgi:hypothetical protein